ncbi:sugar-binding protein [Bacteroidota bacterium]
MKKLLLVSLLFVLSGSIFGQEYIINSFDQEEADTNYWAFYQNDNADDDSSFINISFVGDFVEGTGAMQLEYMGHNNETWGGFAKLEHWFPDSTDTYDFSLYDTISFWYNNTILPEEAGRIHLRINLHDVSENGPAADDVGDCEYYYGFNYILDNEPGWKQVKIPLIGGVSQYWDGDGFNLTGWSGIQGNQTLDLDQINGFSFEFSVNGTGEGDAIGGTIIIDKFHLTGMAENPVVFFNGAAIPSGVELYGGWGGGGYEITDEEAYTPGTNSVKWITPPNDWALWDGLVWTLPETANLGFRWEMDSLQFKIKADAGFGDIKVVLADDDSDGWVDDNGDGADDTPDLGFEAGYLITEAEAGYDGTWRHIKVPLSNLNRFDGAWDGVAMRAGEMDSTRVYQLKILIGSTAGVGKIVYLDDIWTGSPEFDVVPPEAPGTVTASPGDYSNVVVWTDVPGEEGEVYDVYYSLDPIADLEAAGVDIVKLNVPENDQEAEHILKAPATDQDVDYYYAVVCKDAAGNNSEISSTSTPITNTAKGVPTIHPSAPVDFAADGELGEWAGITPFSVKISEGTGFVPQNSTVDNDDDCSLTAYVAVDNEYMYLAFDVTDDINSIDTTIATYLTDGADIFIGLFNWHGAPHTSFKRGAEPDYQFRFISNGVVGENPGGSSIFLRPTSDRYSFTEKFPSGYIVEAKLSWEEIAGQPAPDDDLFSPVVGMRIPIDFAINDADATGEREGILTFSPNNEDLSYQDPSRWTYTWIGDSFTDVEDEDLQPLTFELSQNYPNPFNPSTQISYSIKEKSNVTLSVFNLLGQEVATLVNEVKAPGVYKVDFNALNLATGVYIYQIKAGSFVNAKKMMLIK